MQRFPMILLGLLFLSGSALGQGAHYTYPFSVVCPEYLVEPGSEVKVEAKFEGGFTGDRYKPSYNWGVTSGEIVSGQGTAVMMLRIPNAEGSVINVSLYRTFLEAHFPSVQREAGCSIAVQAVPKPRMIDEFRTRGDNCEEGFARLDSYFVELNNDPTSRGFIVLYADTRDRQAASVRELQLMNHFAMRNVSPDRVTFVRGVARQDGTTQFWMVPPGAQDPEIEREKAGAKQRPTTPYLYGANFLDGVAGCSGHLYDVGKYASELKSLNRSRGRIVIGQTSRALFNRELKAISAELAAAGIPRSRYTTIYKYVRPNRVLEFTELWIIPK